MRFTSTLTVLAVLTLSVGCKDASRSDSPNPVISALLIGGIGLGNDIEWDCTHFTNYSNATGKTNVTVAGSTASSSFRADDNAVTGAGMSFAASPYTFTATFDVTGRLAVGTYTGLTAGTVGNLLITDGGTKHWSAATGDVGTFTLKVTNVEKLVDTSGGTGYTITGTLDATVPAVSATGAVGTATVHADLRSN